MTDKSKALLAYLLGWIGGLIVLLGLKDNTKNVKIHAAQSIVISVGYFVITIAYNFIPIAIPFFTTIMGALYLICIIMGIEKAATDKAPELPVVGDLAKSLFKNKIEE